MNKQELMGQIEVGNYSNGDRFHYTKKSANDNGEIVMITEDGLCLVGIWNGAPMGNSCWINTYSDEAEFIEAANDACSDDLYPEED